MKKVAILQSNYIPWKGYFDLIASVDEFILYDDMQFTRRDWRNRNLIKTAQGPRWLTIPVSVKGKYHQSIRETELIPEDWIRVHAQSLRHSYKNAAHFEEVSSIIDRIYDACREETHLSPLNRRWIEAICAYLGIKTVIKNSWDYTLEEGKTERLVSLCKQANASEYVSGPAAKDYLDEKLFQAEGIDVRWMDYSGYSEYPQLWGEFTHQVSILDLLLNCGKDAPSYMKQAQWRTAPLGAA